MRRYARLLGLCCLALCTSCSYVYDVLFEITIADDVDIPEGSSVVAVVVEEESMESLEDAVGTSQSATADRRTYSIEEGACCAPEPRVSLYAFLDLDGNGTWSEGEPRGEDSRNPIVLRDDSAPTRSEIEIVAP